MRYVMSVIIVVTLALHYDSVVAQRQRPPADHGNPPHPERLEKFKKMRLIEILKLNEEDAARFVAKQNVHEDKQRELMKSRNGTLDDIQDIVRDEKGETKNISELTAQILDIDKKVFDERQRFQEEMRQFLTPEQFGKFLLFERNFGRQLRDALQEMHEEHHNGNRY